MIFDEIIDRAIESEGGSKITKDTLDLCGIAKYGISQRAYLRENIEGLSREWAEELHYNDYWIPSRAEKVPDHLKEIYFDMVVNFGLNSAIKVLQRACNGKNSYKIDVDGRISPATLSACKKLEPDRLRAYRVLKFADIVNRKPTQEKYWYGWYRRALRV